MPPSNNQRAMVYAEYFLILKGIKDRVEKQQRQDISHRAQTHDSPH